MKRGLYKPSDSSVGFMTDSNRPPSYQASANEPESNWHFLSDDRSVPHD